MKVNQSEPVVVDHKFIMQSITSITQSNLIHKRYALTLNKSQYQQYFRVSAGHGAVAAIDFDLVDLW